MEVAAVMDIGRQALLMVILISAPMLGLGLLVGLTVGVLQASEAIKIIAGIEANVGKILLFDAQKLNFDTVKLNRRLNCPVCS